MRIKLNHPGKDDTLLAICLIFIPALLVIFGFYYSAGNWHTFTHNLILFAKKHPFETFGFFVVTIAIPSLITWAVLSARPEKSISKEPFYTYLHLLPEQMVVEKSDRTRLCLSYPDTDMKVSVLAFCMQGKNGIIDCINGFLITLQQEGQSPMFLQGLGGLTQIKSLLQLSSRLKSFRIEVPCDNTAFLSDNTYAKQTSALVQYINEQINNYRLYKKMRILLPSSYKSAQILCPVWILMSLSSLILGWVLVSEFPLFDPYILGILFVFVGVLALTFKLFIYFIKDNLVQRQLRALQPPQHLK